MPLKEPRILFEALLPIEQELRTSGHPPVRLRQICEEAAIGADLEENVVLLLLPSRGCSLDSELQNLCWTALWCVEAATRLAIWTPTR